MMRNIATSMSFETRKGWSCRLGDYLYTFARSSSSCDVHHFRIIVSLSPESRVQLGGVKEEVPHILQVPLVKLYVYLRDMGT